MQRFAFVQCSISISNLIVLRIGYTYFFLVLVAVLIRIGKLNGMTVKVNNHIGVFGDYYSSSLIATFLLIVRISYAVFYKSLSGNIASATPLFSAV